MNNNNYNSSAGGVEFDEYKTSGSYSNQDFGDSKMVGLMIKHSGGLIKNGKQASYLLFAIVIILVATALFIGFGNGGRSDYPMPQGFNS